jgi:hypothetical protein
MQLGPRITRFIRGGSRLSGLSIKLCSAKEYYLHVLFLRPGRSVAANPECALWAKDRSGVEPAELRKLMGGLNSVELSGSCQSSSNGRRDSGQFVNESGIEPALVRGLRRRRPQTGFAVFDQGPRRGAL